VRPAHPRRRRWNLPAPRSAPRAARPAHGAHAHGGGLGRREIKYKLKEFLGLDIDPLDPPSPGGPDPGARERPALRNSMRAGALDHGYLSFRARTRARARGSGAGAARRRRGGGGRWAAGGGADVVTPIDPIAEEEAPPPRPDGRRRPSLHALPPTVKAPAPPGQGSPELGEEGHHRRHHHHHHHHHSHTDSPRDKDDRKAPPPSY
jgi:hypothetical protein